MSPYISSFIVAFWPTNFAFWNILPVRFLMTVVTTSSVNYSEFEAICFVVFQIKNLGDIVPAVGGNKFLSMLPPWHCYERASEYFAFTRGIEQFYTTVRKLKVL